MNLQGYRRFTVSLDESPTVRNAGLFALRDSNEYKFDIELKSRYPIPDLSEAQVRCRIIYNPRANDRVTYVWDGEIQNGHVLFTMPEEAHARVGSFALYVSVVTGMESFTVFFANGVIIEKESDQFFVDDPMSFEELLEAAKKADEAIAGITAESEEQLQRIQEKTDDAIQAIQDKGDRIISDLPEDFGDLVSKVAVLRADLENGMASVEEEQAEQNERIEELEKRPLVDPTLSNRVDNLDAAAEGNLYRVVTDSEEAYVKIVPDEVMPWAMVNKVGCFTNTEEGITETFTPVKVSSIGKNLLDMRDSAIVSYYNSEDKTTVRYGFEFTPSETCVLSARGWAGNVNNPLRLYWVDDNDVYHAIPDIADSMILNINGAHIDHILTPGMHYFMTPTAGSVSSLKDRTQAALVQIERGTTPTAFMPYVGVKGEIDLQPIVDEFYPDGMWHLGTSRDEIDLENGVAVKTTGKLPDASAYTWNNAGNSQFWLNVTTKLAGRTNVYCPAYRTSATLTDGCIGGYDSSQRIWIIDHSCETSAQLKEKLAGVPILYERSAIVEQPIEGVSGDIAVEAGGKLVLANNTGEEVPLPNEVKWKIKMAAAGYDDTEIKARVKAVEDEVQVLDTGLAELSDDIAQQGQRITALETEKEWVLKGTLTTDNKGTGVTVDLTGCTEVYFKGSIVGTNGSDLRCNMTLDRMVYQFAYNGTRYVRMLWKTQPLNCGIMPVVAKWSTAPSLQGDNLTAYSVGAMNANWGVHDINKLYLSAPENVTSCNIEIYAR